MFELTPAEYQEHLSEKLAMLPEKPGVYLHKNLQDEIIYVGKAVILKNRVRSYFQSPKNHPPKVCALVGNIVDFDYIICDTEAEALTLESNLIKQYRPRYNILLKDDKSFPYVRIDMTKPFPRVEIVHKIQKDGARYFGPYLSKYAVRESMEAIRENFPLRTCKKDIDRAITRGERPCLNYHIGKCMAPCNGQVTREEYREVVEEVISFLKGETDVVIAKLRIDMAKAADEMLYERAALIRDRIKAIEVISEKQKAIAANKDERDVFAFARVGTDAVVFALMMRDGRIIGAEHYTMLAPDDEESEVMDSFMKQFYGAGVYVPKEILVKDLPTEMESIARWLSERRGNKVEILQPVRGSKRKLIKMAYDNGIEYLEKMASTKRREWERTEGALRDLSMAIGVDELPERMECFDISHTQGTDPVASMVVFIGGKPVNKLYRRFRIKSVTNNDYAAMQEVITRRFSRALEERAKGVKSGWAEMPDLLIIDGGKGQLSCALDSLHELGLYEGEDLYIIGLAERLEEIFLPDESQPVILDRGTPALHMLQRIRDEAHRFAISYHRSLRQKTALFSVLDEIPGVGTKRRKALFEAFVSLDAIKQATVEELRAAKGMDIRSAKAVFTYFHPEHNDTETEVH